MIKKRRTAMFLLFVLLSGIWMAVIFGFSSNNADDSTDQSNKVTRVILSVFILNFEDLREETRQDLIDRFDGLVRKTAHFCAYALLGALTCAASGSLVWLPYDLLKPSALAVGICVVFAVTDEYHQTLVDGRAGRWMDVLIDGSGAVAGALFCSLVVFYVFRQMRRN